MVIMGTVASNSNEDIQMETVNVGEKLHGKSFDEVEQKLGTPSQEERFNLGMEVTEFRVELSNIFDADRRTENPPDIREATWSLSSEKNLTLWFTQASEGGDWCVIHSIQWHPDDQF
jgi:hypothetical protein